MAVGQRWAELQKDRAIFAANGYQGEALTDVGIAG
jgi:hypothetical protein